MRYVLSFVEVFKKVEKNLSDEKNQNLQRFTTSRVLTKTCLHFLLSFE